MGVTVISTPGAEPEAFDPPMSLKVHRKLGKAILMIARSLKLTDWSFTLSMRPVSEEGDYGEALATCLVTAHRRHADIQLCVNFMELDYEEQWHVLIHEVLHCHTGPMKQFVEDTLPDLVGVAAWQVFDNAFNQHEETLVDNIATSLAQLMDVDDFVRFVYGKKALHGTR